MGAVCAAATLVAACASNGIDVRLLSQGGVPKNLNAAIAADEPRAALLGRSTLIQGGTAADAAVAMALVMAVTLPSRVGLTGGGVCVVHDHATKAIRTLDFLPRSPQGAGGLAAPGMLRGLAALHAAYGRLRWEQLVSNAENLALTDRSVARAFANDLAAFAPTLERDAAARAVFLDAAGKPLAEGAALAQLDLGGVLGQVRLRGAGALYNGPLAATIAEALGEDVQAVRAYQPEWRPTQVVPFDLATIHFAGLPEAGGGAASQAWQAVAAAPAGEWPRQLVAALANQGPAAPATAIPAKAAISGAAPGQANDVPPTASLVVLDPFDQAVACTFTLGGPFGSGRMIPGTGLFAAVDRGAAGIGGPAIEINTALDETLFMAAGASGGGGDGPAAAPAALVAVARRALNDGQAAPDAVAAARVAPGSDPGTVLVEQAAEPAIAAALTSQGLRVEAVPAIGRATVVNCLIDRKTDVKTCLAASDPRGFGLAQNIER